MFENTYLVTDKLKTFSAAEVDAAEAQLGIRFPEGYREYMTRLGVGEYCNFVVIHDPANIVRNDLQRNFLDGPADLAVEIVSPESILRDRGTKYAEYEAGGVREYWILDPETQRADFFVLDAEGRYQPAQPDTSGRYDSAVLAGFWINVGWLWQTPLPLVRQVLREWEAA